MCRLTRWGRMCIVWASYHGCARYWARRTQALGGSHLPVWLHTTFLPLPLLQLALADGLILLLWNLCLLGVHHIDKHLHQPMKMYCTYDVRVHSRNSDLASGALAINSKVSQAPGELVSLY